MDSVTEIECVIGEHRYIKGIKHTVAVDYLDASSASHNQGTDICGSFHPCEL